MEVPMPSFELSAELTPVLAKFLAHRSPVDVSRGGGAERSPLWPALVDEVGVAGLLVAEEHGGQGASLVEVGAAALECGRVGWSGPVVATAGVAASLLGALDPDDAAGLQRAVAHDGAVVVAAFHEDPRGAACTSTASYDAPALTARRVHVDSGTHADTVLVEAVDGDGVPVLCAVGADDAEVVAMDSVDPGRGLARVEVRTATASVVARGPQVPDAVADAWLVGALLSSADALGAASRVLDLARDYAVDRQQFGRPVATFQSVKHKLVDMFAELETARSMVRHALEEAAARSDGWRLAASAAAARTGDATMLVVREGVQVHGGIGFTWEHEVSHHFRRVTAARALYGTPARHRALLAEGMGF
ncbi:acyl-CoA dehydrogenase [Nocardioides sp. C4-1]|uniref:acyl-CoA dehydrogenase family protein n=1 Tax=Nocardioides sp. C4-1 TaxID=3151851 RepID=UPI0032652843